MSDVRRARAALSRLVEPGDKAVHALVGEVGPVEAVERICAGRGTYARFGARVRTLDTGRDLATAAKVGARLVVPGDDEWPERLDDLPTPPFCLWVRGPVPLGEALGRSVAVVGARIASSYGEQLAAELAAGLATRGWTVVSGAAFGIDAAAHRGALAVDGATVAMLASGVDRVYPAAHSRLLARIAETGAVVSEVAPGCAPMKSRFLQRNRLIAAATRGTVVVEAGLRSGSRNTVTHASELARPVGAVPGPVTSMSSAGCHQEIRDGRATLVTSADEVIDLVGDLGQDACEPARGPVAAGDALLPRDAAVLEALPYRGGLDLERVVALTTLPPLIVRAALTRLELEGLAETDGTTWRKRRSRTAHAVVQ
ncbi:DNA protecting protein DprA [Intrasporangium oryzae NRRL B-24470]|uniref:DNA protecting protein DprA n=1 Tax=Intrasporangium oryzae NRRL B-24470 TaxID=1386089 RepID=W9G9N1_9MICO|nr:DNA-processing protein DprA [Intrasporangium oryzae]EWT01508.1 DNA protecting protein DprA [Intrasporangium oryzae NRRL B-24470]